MRKHRIHRSALAVAIALIIAFGFGSCAQEDKTSLYIAGGAVMTNDGIGYDLTGSIVLLEDMSTPVMDGATVTVNGDELIPFFMFYTGSVTPVIPGESIPFSISYNGVSVNQSLTAPCSVAISAPAPSSTVPVDEALVVSWTVSSEDGETTPPAWVSISVPSSNTNFENGISELVPFSDGHYTIAAGSLKADMTFLITVSGVSMQGVSASGVMAGSMLMVENERAVSISTTAT